MRVADFMYDLPERLIAQTPAPRRDGSRLLVIPESDAPCEHRSFHEIGSLLKPGDLLVLNDTRVIPARLHGRKPSGGKVEILLDRPVGTTQFDGGRYYQRWSCLWKASKPVRAGSEVYLAAGGIAQVAERSLDDAEVIVVLDLPQESLEFLNRHGEVPLPPYIKRSIKNGNEELDRERYQTVFARDPGAVAAPTAGLHFTEELLGTLRTLGVELAYITLHIGFGTFQPIRGEALDEHVMHAERFTISAQTAAAIAAAKKKGKRVVAVGTTVVRALETAFWDGAVQPGAGETRLFLRPGSTFRVIDALLTNFHLPGSTLLMLVCAFRGRERVLAAYREAVAREYRFFSYGDAMFLE
jgi:S-adenosylmethionine:tRNA ribosyltransferase-isomerase